MSEQIKDLVYAIAQSNAAESENLLNSIMSQKALSALDNMRVDVAKNMFNTPQQDDAE
jgi:hypothetical protein